MEIPVILEIENEGKRYTFGDAPKVDGKTSCHGCLMPNKGDDSLCYYKNKKISTICALIGFRTMENGFDVNCQVIKIEDIKE